MSEEKTSAKWIVLLKLFLYWILFLISLVVVGILFSSRLDPKWERFVYGIGGSLFAFGLTFIFLRQEKSRFSEYNLDWNKNSLFNFLKGLFTGSCIFGVIILILLISTDIILTKNSGAWNPLSILWYLSIVPLALMEEIVFRSYSFVKLNKYFGLFAAQIITSLVFALYHIAQGWGILIAFLGPAIWSLVFGLGAVWSKGIAMPTGIHVALNLIQQLLGTKGEPTESPWLFQLPGNASAESTTRAEYLGIVTQLLVLTSVLILTLLFIRVKTNRNETKHPV